MNDEIVVTAQFREQNLQDTPLAITAVDAQTMRARGQSQVYQIANQAPSVTLKPQNSNFGPSLSANIRGIGQVDFNPALEPGVGIYVDEVYFPTLMGSIFDLLDLERVEVLRGPQGTLTGRNSIGGAIKLISKKPSEDFNAFVETGYGSRDRVDFRGAISGPIAEGLYGRISGVIRRQDGYVDRIDYGCANPGGGIPANPAAPSDCVLSKQGDVGYEAVRGTLRFAPNDRLDVTLSGDWTLDKRNAAGEVVLVTAPTGNPAFTDYSPTIPYDDRFICGSYCNYATYSQPAVPPFAEAFSVQNKTRFEGYGGSLNVDFDLTDNLNVTSITAYREYDTYFADDSDLSPANAASGESMLIHDFFSQEVRLNGELGEDVVFTLGGYYSDQTTVYPTKQDLRYVPPVGLQFMSSGDTINADSKAVFATIIWSPLDNLNLTGGVRYTDEHKDYTYYRANFDGTPHPLLGALDGVTGDFDGDKVDYRVSIDYRWNDNFMTYATIATGFKGGGVNPRPFFATQVQSFGQEQARSIEAGFKSDFLDNRARLNVTGFYNDVEGIQLTLLSCDDVSPFPGAPCALPSNAGDAEIKGIEAEAFLEPVDGFTIDGSFSYIDFDYTRINPITGLSDTFVPPLLPEIKWSVGVQYAADLGEHGTLTPRFDASFQDDIYTNAANSPLNVIENYILANARLEWRNKGGDLSAALEVSNLFDKYYFLTRFNLIAVGAGTNTGQPGRPREFFFKIRKEF
ncbi:TonB-dependent receptor [Hyphococcus luteus]|uniref:TonB-dependent receptor n=1 Tax=Hyphococcus luteus TaxID=2058213 RepID=UPI001A9C3751|nr:TonB-dependent receptor [Marinicaulis flavus]